MVSDQEEVNDMYRIMLVEDDATIVDILSRQLEKWGYLVRAVQDFDRVREEFREFQPQLVLMDLSLPFFNGYYWCVLIMSLIVLKDEFDFGSKRLDRFKKKI